MPPRPMARPLLGVAGDGEEAVYDVLLRSEGVGSPAPPARPAKAAASAAPSNSNSAEVWFWAAASVLSNVLMIVSLRKLGLRTPDYAFETLTVGCFAFNVPFLALAYWRHYTTPGGTITPAMATWRWKMHYFATGALLAVNGVCVLFANPYVPGALQAILLNSGVPVSIVFSALLLGTRFRAAQYVGALAVIGGVTLTLVPEIQHHELSGAETQWIIVFFLASVPGVLNFLYQQYLYEWFAAAEPDGKGLDVFYLMAMSNVGQSLTMLFIWPVDLIPGFGNSDSVASFASHYRDGMRCFAGQPVDEAPNCDLVWVNLLAFVCSYVLANVCGSYLTKLSTGAFAVVVQVSSTVLATAAFSLHFIMQSHTGTFGVWDGVGLAVVVAGVVLYRVRIGGDDDDTYRVVEEADVGYRAVGGGKDGIVDA